MFWFTECRVCRVVRTVRQRRSATTEANAPAPARTRTRACSPRIMLTAVSETRTSLGWRCARAISRAFPSFVGMGIAENRARNDSRNRSSRNVGKSRSDLARGPPASGRSKIFLHAVIERRHGQPDGRKRGECFANEKRCSRARRNAPRVVFFDSLSRDRAQRTRVQDTLLSDTISYLQRGPRTTKPRSE